MKLFRNGQMAKREYRGQRSAESLASFVREQLKDPVKEFMSVDETYELSVRHLLRFDAVGQLFFLMHEGGAAVLRTRRLRSFVSAPSGHVSLNRAEWPCAPQLRRVATCPSIAPSGHVSLNCAEWPCVPQLRRVAMCPSIAPSGHVSLNCAEWPCVPQLRRVAMCPSTAPSGHVSLNRRAAPPAPDWSSNHVTVRS